MKAIFFEQHGGIEVLKYADLPDPEPKPGEALIRVRAAALNHIDIWVRRGWEGLRLKMPHITGCDIAGEIVAVNAAQSGWITGTRVIVNPGIVTAEDEWTRRGDDSLSPSFKLIGAHLPGGLGEFVCVPIGNVFKLPEKLSFEEGAAPLFVGGTCWRMLFRRAHLQAGETVLLVGAGGGVNSMAISLAKAAGASVIALTSSRKKMEVAEKLGCSHVINYRDTPQWPAQVLRLTQGRGADLVVDNVGAKTFSRSVRAARRGGRIVTVGNTSGLEVKYDNSLVSTKQISIIGSNTGGRQDFIDALQFMLKNDIKPIIDRVEPLKRGIEMMQYLEEGRQFGKIVLRP